MAYLCCEDRSFKAHLAAVIGTLCCMAEYVADKGDARVSSVLLNTADLLEVAIGAPMKAAAQATFPKANFGYSVTEEAGHAQF